MLFYDNDSWGYFVNDFIDLTDYEVYFTLLPLYRLNVACCVLASLRALLIGIDYNNILLSLFTAITLLSSLFISETYYPLLLFYNNLLDLSSIIEYFVLLLLLLFYYYRVFVDLPYSLLLCMLGCFCDDEVYYFFGTYYCVYLDFYLYCYCYYYFSDLSDDMLSYSSSFYYFC